MLKKALFPGKYIQGASALAELPKLVTLLGRRALLLASPHAHEHIIPASGLEEAVASLRIERFGRECCERELSRLAAVLQEHGADVLVGMGGGKTIDAAKIAADRAGIPVIVVPTVASTDAPCSGCAVIYSEQGSFERVYYQKSNPSAVLVDSAIIARAPVRFLVSGMGDALATWFEARSCAATQSPNACGGLSTLSGVHLARLCYDTLLACGLNAKLAVERHIVTPDLDKIIEANTLLSGIGFESGGLGAAHSIHNGFTVLPATHAHYHGEKVAFGVLAGLQLTGACNEESQAVFAFCEEVGLPTTLADLSLPDVNREDLMRAAEKACAPEECIHHEAGGIDPERVLNAMLAADAVGAYRKGAGG